MKKVSLTISLALVIFAFTACKQNGPEPIVEKFCTHLGKGEFEEAKKYVVAEHHSFYDMMQQLSAMAPDSSKGKEVKVTDVKCTITDDNAVCTCMLKEGDKEAEEQTVKMKKVDGAWLVNQGKEGGASDTETTLSADEEVGADATEEEVPESAE